jgi:hypothetical protein
MTSATIEQPSHLLAAHKMAICQHANITTPHLDNKHQNSSVSHHRCTSCCDADGKDNHSAMPLVAYPVYAAWDRPARGEQDTLFDLMD